MNVVLRFFIILIFLLLFWPSLIFPRRAVNPAPARRTRHHAISCPAIYFSVGTRFLKMQRLCQEEKIKLFLGDGKEAERPRRIARMRALGAP
jgi:hypothetical protein